MRGRLFLSEPPSQKHLRLLQLFQSLGMSSLNIQFREVFAIFFSNISVNYFFLNASQINQCLSDMEPLFNLMWCCLSCVWISGILILLPVFIQTVISDLPNMQNHALLLLKTISDKSFSSQWRSYYFMFFTKLSIIWPSLWKQDTWWMIYNASEVVL